MRSAAGLAAALLGAAILLGAGLGRALACAICLSAVSVSTGQKLDASDQVALAAPLSDGERFRIVETVKGDMASGVIVEATSDHAESFPAATGTLSLIARNGLSGLWSNFGAIGAGSAPWLRELLRSNDGKAKAPPHVWPIVSPVQAVPDSTNWPKRIALIGPYLESGDPLAAEIAFGELSRAPYETVRLLRPGLDPVRIRRWIQDPALAQRHDAYLLLLGIAGDGADTTMLENRLGKARTAQDATNVAAMLAADLELRGPSRVDWIETNYLLDHNRSLPEIDAALLALDVHGGAGGIVSRQRVVDAYRNFIRERKPMAGFVATYLSSWQAWDAVPDYIEVLRSKAVQDPASQFAILVYLQDSQNATAQAAAAAFTAQAN